MPGETAPERVRIVALAGRVTVRDDERAEIRSDTGGLLVFSNPEHPDPSGPVEYWTTSLTVPGLSATRRVYDNHADALGRFFERMSADWRGWTGSREWKSVEEDLTLSATFDRTGRIHLDVGLVNRESESPWAASAVLTVASGESASIARSVAAFFGQPPVSPRG